jgi:hypothetical protein
LKVRRYFAGLVLWLMPWTADAAWMCPGCVPTVNETRAEIVARCDVVLLTQWKQAQAVTDQEAAFTEFEITLVGKDREFIAPPETKADDDAKPEDEAKPEDNKDEAAETPPPAAPVVAATFKPGQKLRLDQFLDAEPGSLFFLTGTRNKTGTVDWEPPAEITETAYHYVMQAPSPEVPQTERLRFYLKFLESSNEFIANDAYNEFALAAFEDVVPLQDDLPLDNLRKWLTDDKTTPTHLGLYGILLGLGGSRSDAEILKQAFLGKKKEYSLGVEGAITGFLFLTGADGVQVIEDEILKNTKANVDEVYPVMKGLEIVWTYGADRVARPRLIEAMRLTLQHQFLQEFAVITLTRWQDWQIVDQLAKLYETVGPDASGTRTNIVMFMLTCSKATHEVDGAVQPVPQAQQAAEFVERVREVDPLQIEKAERFLRPIPRRTPERKTDG